MESNIFSERNIISIVIVVITVIILAGTFESVKELFIEKDEDNYITNLFIKENALSYETTNSDDSDTVVNMPVNVKGIIDISGSKIKVVADKVLVDSKNELSFDPVAFNFFDETGQNKIKIIKESDLAALKTQYSTLETKINTNTKLLTTAEETAKDLNTKMILQEETIGEQEETIKVRNDILMYGGIGAGIVLLLCILFTYLFFKKK